MLAGESHWQSHQLAVDRSKPFDGLNRPSEISFGFGRRGCGELGGIKAERAGHDATFAFWCDDRGEAAFNSVLPRDLVMLPPTVENCTFLS